MTGNKNAWRAPLAGLASVAMLATMGVAAGTANAVVDSDYPVVTLHTDGEYLTVGGKQTNTAEIQDTNKNGIQDKLVSMTAHNLNQNPSNPTSNWVFTGWYTSDSEAYEPGQGTAFDPSQDVTADVDLYAHYAQANDYVNVKFPTDGKTTYANGYYSALTSGAYNEFNIAYGDTVADWQAAFTDAAADYYLTTGYTYGGKAFDLAGQTGKALADKVTNADSSTNYKQLQLENVAVKGDPNNPSDPDVGKIFSVRYHNAGVKNDKDVYSVTGVTYDGSDEFDVLEGKTVESRVATDPATGYTTSVYVNQANGKTYDFSAPVQEDLVLVPDFSAASKSYVVTYDLTSATQRAYALKAGGNKTESVKAGEAAKDTAAPAAAKKGFKFFGWSETNYPTTAGVKDIKLADLSKVTKDITVYAVYVADSSTVTYYAGYGSSNKVYTTQTYADGDYFKAPADPTRDGYVFDGWSPAIVANGQKLHINASGSLYYYKGGTTGDSAQTLTPTFLTTSYTAKWKRADAASLVALENKVPQNYLLKSIKNADGDITGFDAANYKNGSDADQPYFTADTFDQYVKDWQSYQRVKATKGNLSQEEIKELYSLLKGYQDKLVETTVQAYRFYNPFNGDHVYFTDQNEANFLTAHGWNNETKNSFNVVLPRTADTGTAFGDGTYSTPVPANLGEAVVRAYNPYTGEHLMTSDTVEYKSITNNGWTKDYNGGAIFYTPQGGDKPVVRLYNKYATNAGSHHYTADSTEASALVNLGWVNEQVKFNVF